MGYPPDRLVEIRIAHDLCSLQTERMEKLFDENSENFRKYFEKPKFLLTLSSD